MKKLLLPLFLITTLFSDTVEFWEIQKVKSWDVLNIRSEANFTSKKVAGISYKETCLINHGCGQNIDLESMMHMDEEAVKAFLSQAKEDWCYVEYKGKKGWVSKHYLTKSTSTCTK